MKLIQLLSLITFLFFPMDVLSQDIELFQQFNGHYDYTAFGNTLNPHENNIDESFCEILPSSQASLNLSASSTIVAAFLYWAGSGAGDTSVALNGIPIEAQQIYNVDYNDQTYGALTYFSCFTDITDIITIQGNISYEFSQLDISNALMMPGYCNNRTNFGGWSVFVFYENDSLPLNQINLFQGMEIINRNNQEKIIQLNGLNVIDNVGAKIGFLTWEGDQELNYGETLSINDNILSNPPLNPGNNAFNGTNTFTNSNTFYNCDLDVYDIQNNIAIGDTSATIKLTTGDYDQFGVFRADLIIINNIITVLNSQLPDATVEITDSSLDCENQLMVSFAINNFNSTDILPANTPIAFYIDNLLVGQSATQNDIAINGSENQTVILNIPFNFVNDFDLTIAVDDDGTQTGNVTEINENNNTVIQNIEVFPIPEVQNLSTITECNQGLNTATFQLIDALSSADDTLIPIDFYLSLSDLISQQNELFSPETFHNSTNPQDIYIKVQGDPCYEIYHFQLTVENCPPIIPDGFSPNDDSYNDWFNIQGLYDIYLSHKLLIYNRYGTLIFEGDNSHPWDGKSNRGLNNIGSIMPVGIYFYFLQFNDPEMKDLHGWVYMNY